MNLSETLENISVAILNNLNYILCKFILFQEGSVNLSVNETLW